MELNMYLNNILKVRTILKLFVIANLSSWEQEFFPALKIGRFINLLEENGSYEYMCDELRIHIWWSVWESRRVLSDNQIRYFNLKSINCKLHLSLKSREQKHKDRCILLKIFILLWNTVFKLWWFINLAGDFFVHGTIIKPTNSVYYEQTSLQCINTGLVHHYLIMLALT